jgi:hypothetical protein
MKTQHLTTLVAIGLAGSAILQAQNPPAPSTPPAAPPAAGAPPATDAPPAPWSIGEIKFSGLIDGYYSHNFNNPASGFNTLRNFDVKSRSFALNMVEFSMFHDPEPVGFRVDLGFGRAWDIVHATDPGRPDIVRYFPQAYVSLKPASWGGFQFDFGKFYTSVGAELTENNYTWSYGRGYLYTNGPYYHFGARMTKPVAKNFTVGVQIVNGWNNVEDNNTGKTVGFTTAWTGKKISWLTNTYVGPEKNGTNKGVRGIYESVINLTPNDKFSAYIDYYHGRENQASGPGSKSADWDALGLSGRVQMDVHNALALRWEIYADHDGFTTGQSQNLKSFTTTYEYKWTKGLLSRLEYRRDWSNKPYFERGNSGSPLNISGLPFTPGPWKNQNTLTLGFVAFFGPK